MSPLLAAFATASVLATTGAAAPAVIDTTKATPVSEEYRRQFAICDGRAPHRRGMDTFRGHGLWIGGKPSNEQYWLCSRDPSRLEALLKLPDGAIYWRSKMALDMDGSWAAWSGKGGPTDQRFTQYRWRGGGDPEARSAQVDPDRIPYVVIPSDGIGRLTGKAASRLGAEFRRRTGLRFGDMGVVIYRGRWVPVLIADGGPFMKIGEASVRVFEALGEDRCRRWNATRDRCIGRAGRVYLDEGIDRDVEFVLYPGSADPTLTPENALSKLCAFARTRLGLTGSEACRSGIPLSSGRND